MFCVSNLADVDHDISEVTTKFKLTDEYNDLLAWGKINLQDPQNLISAVDWM